jgi:hypothetical protein
MPEAVQRRLRERLNLFRPELRSEHAFAVDVIPDETLLENDPGQEHSGAAVISSEARAGYDTRLDRCRRALTVSDRW